MDSSGPKGQTEARSAEGPSEQRAATEPDPEGTEGEAPPPPAVLS